MKKGSLIVVSGPSGTGKGTICKELLQIENKIVLSISATTRNPREGEVNGKNYFFIDKEFFEKEITQDGFLEYAKVFDHYYGTPKKYVIDQLNNGNNVLLEIDVQGALQVKKQYPEALLIFILPPSMKELKNRIIGRGTESQEDIEKRFRNAIEEIKYVKEYDYYIVNDEVRNAVDGIINIIKAHKYKVAKDIEKMILKFKEECSC